MTVMLFLMQCQCEQLKLDLTAMFQYCHGLVVVTTCNVCVQATSVGALLHWPTLS